MNGWDKGVESWMRAIADARQWNIVSLALTDHFIVHLHYGSATPWEGSWSFSWSPTHYLPQQHVRSPNRLSAIISFIHPRLHKKGPYNRSIQIIRILLQLSHRIRFILRTLNNRARLLCSNIFENALELVGGGRFFSNFKLEFLSLGVCLMRMITSLVFRGILGGIGRGLLQETVNPEGSWESWLVEESDNIESFVLGWMTLLAFES